MARVRILTRWLGEAGNPAITEPEVLSAAVEWASKLKDAYLQAIALIYAGAVT